VDQLDCGGAGQGDGGSYHRVQPRPRHRKERLRCVISSLQGTDCSPATQSDSDYAQYFFSKANEPILSWYIFTFRQLAQGSSMSSTHSRMPVRHHRVRAPRPANRTRQVAEAMQTQPLPHHPLVASPLWLSHPLRPCRALKMYVVCPCPHAIQLQKVAANAPRQHQILSLLYQWVVLRPRDYNKLNVRGASLPATSEHWLGGLTGV
jgi:hypothetical protein